MQESIQIRPAQPGDAEVAAVLLYSAYTHTHVIYPLPEARESRWIEQLEHYFQEAGNRFSYQNVQVAEHRSGVVGLVLSFGGRDEARLNAAVGRWLEREAQDDEWYVDALAVLKNWGHKGIGTRLMQHAEQQARQHRYTKIALHVAAGNTEALQLYTNLHYVITGQVVLYHRPHVHMLKSIETREQGNEATRRAQRRSL